MKEQVRARVVLQSVTSRDQQAAAAQQTTQYGVLLRSGKVEEPISRLEQPINCPRQLAGITVNCDDQMRPVYYDSE